MSLSGLPHRGVSVVDDLSHEVGEEDGLGDDGEPGEQVTDAQPQQLRGHLQHGEPQQPHGGLGLSQGDRRRSHMGNGDKKKKNASLALGSHLALFALRVPAGGVGVPAAVPVPLPAPPPVSGFHLVQVVHAARRLDEEGGVGAAVAVAVVAHAAVVGEGAGRLAVEGVAVAGLARGRPRAGG